MVDAILDGILNMVDAILDGMNVYNVQDECIWLFPTANVEIMTNVCVSVKNVIDSVNHTDCQSVPAVPNKHATPSAIKQIQFAIKQLKI